MRARTHKFNRILGREYLLISMSELSKAISEFITTDFVLGGLFGTLSFLFGILVKHVISMREEMIKRELEMRKEEKEFFMELYGHISTMTDLVNGLRARAECDPNRNQV